MFFPDILLGFILTQSSIFWVKCSAHVLLDFCAAVCKNQHMLDDVLVSVLRAPWDFSVSGLKDAGAWSAKCDVMGQRS